MGASIGAAIAGMRPVPEIMFMDFLGVAFDQLANHAAKLRYMSGGRTPAPITVRVNMVGGTPIGAAQPVAGGVADAHPGLKVVFLSTPYDAKGLLLACIEDEDPCVFIESTAPVHEARHGAHRALHHPDRQGRHPARGDDVTIISYGRLMYDARRLQSSWTVKDLGG